MWQYLTLVIILLAVVIALVVVKRKREHFQSTITGGSESTLVTFKSGDSTLLRRLLGDSGQTIVLLHDAPLNLQLWETLYMHTQGLKNKGQKIPTLYSYDLHGHGTAWVPVDPKYDDSNIHNIAWPLSKFSEELYELYQTQIKTGKITLVGYGFGGAVAQDFALKHSEVLDHLYILSSTIGPTENEIPSEVNYLVNWLAKNPGVSYLTLQNTFVHWNMCLWFDNNNLQVCNDPRNANDTRDAFNTSEYLLSNAMFTQTSAESYLQTSKILNSTDFRSRWRASQINCPVTFLASSRDYFINVNALKSDIKDVQASGAKTNLYIVNGKHAFVIMHPTYILELIIGNDMSKNPLTLESL